jgi:hypothetical protein
MLAGIDRRGSTVSIAVSARSRSLVLTRTRAEAFMGLLPITWSTGAEADVREGVAAPMMMISHVVPARAARLARDSGGVVTRMIGIALAAAVACGAATVARAVSPAGAGAQASSPSAPPQAAPEAATRPVPSALASTASAQPPVPKGWHWEVQRLGRRVIRVMPER